MATAVLEEGARERLCRGQLGGDGECFLKGVASRVKLKGKKEFSRLRREQGILGRGNREHSCGTAKRLLLISKSSGL